MRAIWIMGTRLRIGLAACPLIALFAAAFLVGAKSPAFARPDFEQSTGCRLAARFDGSTPFGTTACPGVRPGAYVRIQYGGECTLNFVFLGSDGHRYIGTAGHCRFGLDEQEKVWPSGDGPEAWDADGERIGEMVYAVLDDPFGPQPRDFALIRIDRDVKVKAEMCHFGGPTALNRDRSSDALTLQHYGQGYSVGREPGILPARTSVAPAGMPSVHVVYSHGLTVLGDSGGPVTSTDGRAVGLLTGKRTPLLGWWGPAVEGVDIWPRIPVQLERASRALGITLKLRTAPAST